MSTHIDNKTKLKKVLAYEIDKNGNYGGSKLLKYCFINFSERQVICKHQVLLRKTEYYTNTNKKIRAIIYKIMLYRLQNKYSLHIPLNSFGEGMKIMHLGPILVNDKVTVGKDCSIHIGVGLVAGGKSKGVPKLGNGVVLGYGSVVIGDVTIDDNIVVGANSVVTKSFYESNIAIAGNPAKKVSNNGRLNLR